MKLKVGTKLRCIYYDDYYSDHHLTIGKIYVIKRFDDDNDARIVLDNGTPHHFGHEVGEENRLSYIGKYFKHLDIIYMGGE